MFGCGLPVCAVSYSCIEELVEIDRTGLLFSSSSELADEFMFWPVEVIIPCYCKVTKSLSRQYYGIMIWKLVIHLHDIQLTSRGMMSIYNMDNMLLHQTHQFSLCKGREVLPVR
ncbi:hypothetical protein ACH5RR_028277 [Cinchona calisaya]|uniref:Uncharacterized protein n=1 Tax=Cinchona calisaya TaxID=153742 RepID=A0ABD2YPN8_9GENT